MQRMPKSARLLRRKLARRSRMITTALSREDVRVAIMQYRSIREHMNRRAA